MKLTFDAKIVKRLRDHAASASPRSLYGHETGQGLWLVGDQGVYLMSNGDPGLPAPDGSKNKFLVAYAKQCDPEKLEFDEWWANKQASFGGDDGVDFIPLDSIPESGRLQINIGPSQMEIVGLK